MSGRIIADHGVSPVSGKVARSDRSVGGSRMGAALASPRGVLFAIPLLVVVVGALLTFIGQNALLDTSFSMARERFTEQASFAGDRIGQALSQAEPVLDRMRVLSESAKRDVPSDEFALALRDLIAGRPGMTQAYLAFPDGSYQGVYLETDGSLRFQTSRVGPSEGVFHHYKFGDKTLTWLNDETTSYDPRKRDYYRLALERRERAWTAPYPFFTTRNTGVTRVEPIFANGELKGVIGVDFDVSALSAFMARSERANVQSLVFADGGVILAYPSAASRIAKIKPTTHALNYRDVGDPLLDAFFAERQASGRAMDGSLSHFRAKGEDFLTTVANVGGATGPRWYVAVIASERATLSALSRHRQRSLLVAAGALLAAVACAWFFARHIVRARREVESARAQAAEASRHAKELGSYRLVTCLGKGGMGEVWRAEHRLLARHAAIKLIKPELTQDGGGGEVQERFKREAQTIARLCSRNTVELFDYGVTDDGTFFYVMELLDGIDLETLIEKFGPQPAARVVALMLQACNSLAEAHDAGLVHRDIKPANIFICRAADEVDVVKVLDFGLVLSPGAGAQTSGDVETIASAESGATSGNVPIAAVPTLPEGASSRLTLQGSYLGTPSFIAPEQALGVEIDHRADIYALGCVAWWLLTGKLVFVSNDPLVLTMAHVTQEPPPLRPLVAGNLPPQLEELIGACLRKSPDERPANARALASTLRQITFEPSERWTMEAAQVWWQGVGTAEKLEIGGMDTVVSLAPPKPAGAA